VDSCFPEFDGRSWYEHSLYGYWWAIVLKKKKFTRQWQGFTWLAMAEYYLYFVARKASGKRDNPQILEST